MSRQKLHRDKISDYATFFTFEPNKAYQRM